MFGFRRAIVASRASVPRAAAAAPQCSFRLPSSLSLPARGYASEAPASASGADGKLQLSLVLPHETIYQSSGVTQVNIAAESGDMGVLANHVASIESLKPGVVEVIEGQGESKKWFVSGGFANVHPNNLLTINAVEAYPLDAFSPEAARSALQEAQRALNSGSEAQKAEAAVEVEVFESLLAALKLSAGQLKGLISSRESINGHSEQCPTSHTDGFQGRAHKKKKKTSKIDGTVGGLPDGRTYTCRRRHGLPISTLTATDVDHEERKTATSRRNVGAEREGGWGDGLLLGADRARAGVCVGIWMGGLLEMKE